ncbi:hypothetical protein ACET3Z_006086 [Daucus carota]
MCSDSADMDEGEDYTQILSSAHVDDIDLLIKYPPLDDRALNSQAREIDGMPNEENDVLVERSVQGGVYLSWRTRVPHIHQQHLIVVLQSGNTVTEELEDSEANIDCLV